MIDWRHLLVSPDAALSDAIRVIDQGGLQIALVADAQDVLVGVVTDGDVRRALLRGANLQAPVREVMKTGPLALPAGTPRTDVLAFMKRHAVHQVPTLDERGRLVGLEYIDELIKPAARPNWVVLMAGGLGTRLRPLTENCPKPMLMVGGKPILEIILENFIEQGFSKFFLSVNYKAEMIREHFQDGSRWGAQIEYVTENKRMGTAGALTLLPQAPTEPILVMNGDLLTRTDFGQLLDHHTARQVAATMAVREYESQVPLGVVRLNGDRIVDIVEKPIQRHFVNAGMYVLSPEALKQLPPDEFFDMPTLFTRLIETGLGATAFPLQEYWLDIGRMEEFERAQREWGGVG